MLVLYCSSLIAEFESLIVSSAVRVVSNNVIAPSQVLDLAPYDMKVKEKCTFQEILQ